MIDAPGNEPTPIGEAAAPAQLLEIWLAPRLSAAAMPASRSESRRAVDLDQQDVAVGAQRRDRVEVERAPPPPSPNRRWRAAGRPAALVGLAQAAAGDGAGRQPVGAAIGGQVRRGVGVVADVDHRDGVRAARGLRQVGQVVGFLEIGGAARRWRGGGRRGHRPLGRDTRGGRRAAARAAAREDLGEGGPRRDVGMDQAVVRAQHQRLGRARGVAGARAPGTRSRP